MRKKELERLNARYRDTIERLTDERAALLNAVAGTEAENERLRAERNEATEGWLEEVRHGAELRTKFGGAYQTGATTSNDEERIGR